MRKPKTDVERLAELLREADADPLSDGSWEGMARVLIPRLAEPLEHKPGDNHEYRIECRVCGQPGMVHLSIEPQVASAEPKETKDGK